MNKALAMAGVAAVTLAGAAFAVVAQETPATQRRDVAVGATTQSGAVVPAPAPREKGLGISGPGAIHGPNWRRVNRNVTGSAVKSGLLPLIVPIIPETQVRDTVILAAPDGWYYLTGSTGDDIWDHNDGIELWRSKDLKAWDYVGLVWSFEKDGTWQKDWRWHRKPVRAVWAPEIHHVKGNYFLTMSMPPGNRGILKSTSGKPEGPYVNALASDALLPGDIDASLFEDDDGSVYLVYGGGWVARMKDDMSGLAEEPRKPELLNPDTDPRHHAANCPSRRECKDIGFEGAFLFKKDGTYYMTAADSYEGRYSSVVAMSKNVYGPYEGRHEAVPCGGGGDYFKDHEGNWWCAFFGNGDQAPWRERPGIVKVVFGADGKIKPAPADQQLKLPTTAPAKP